jgi:hypothetical protein
MAQEKENPCELGKEFLDETDTKAQISKEQNLQAVLYQNVKLVLMDTPIRK